MTNPSPTNPNEPSPEVFREFPDRGTQWLLEDPVHLRDLLQLLQPELAERLDISRAQRINRTMIPADLQKQESDVIFRIPYRAESEGREWEVLIYVLLEHQSQHDPLMALRLLFYMVELWSEQRRRAEAAHTPEGQVRIDPIIPLVFYTGEFGWTTPLDLAHLMELPAELRRFVPQWDILFLNLHQTSPQTLTQFATAVGYALRVMQSESQPLADLEQVVKEALAGLEGLSAEQSGQWLRVAWFFMLLSYHRRGRAEYHVLRTKILTRTRASKFAERTEVETMEQTMAQYVAEQAREEGIKIGQAEGIKIGRKQTLQEVLVYNLTNHFGELPPAILRIIDAADLEQLDQWVKASYTAASLEAIGIETSQ